MPRVSLLLRDEQSVLRGVISQMFRSGLGLLKGMYVTLKHFVTTYFVD